MKNTIKIAVLFGAIGFIANCSTTTSATSTTPWTACVDTPNVVVNQSTSTTVSHQHGASCMQSGCHGSGAKTFAVMGSVTISKNGTTAVSNTTVSGIGTLGSLTTDSCGNFYSTTTTGLTTGSTPTLFTSMTSGGWSGNNGNLGDCNQSGCHAQASTQGMIY